MCGFFLGGGKTRIDKSTSRVGYTIGIGLVVARVATCAGRMVAVMISRFHVQDVLGFHYVASVTPGSEQQVGITQRKLLM